MVLRYQFTWVSVAASISASVRAAAKLQLPVAITGKAPMPRRRSQTRSPRRAAGRRHQRSSTKSSSPPARTEARGRRAGAAAGHTRSRHGPRTPTAIREASGGRANRSDRARGSVAEAAPGGSRRRGSGTRRGAAQANDEGSIFFHQPGAQLLHLVASHGGQRTEELEALRAVLQQTALTAAPLRQMPAMPSGHWVPPDQWQALAPGLRAAVAVAG